MEWNAVVLNSATQVVVALIGLATATLPVYVARIRAGSPPMGSVQAIPNGFGDRIRSKLVALSNRRLVAIGLVGGLLFFSSVGLAAWTYVVPARDAAKYAVLVPLFAPTQEYLEYIRAAESQSSQEARAGFSEENAYSSKASRDVLYTVKRSAEAWFTKFHSHLKPKQVKFVFFPEGTHEQSHARALDAAIRSAEADGYTVVASIGHVTSNSTKAYAKLYEARKIPLVMPMATGTELPYLLRSEHNVAVLRLVPSNTGQANAIASMLRTAGATGAVVVEDLSNAEYSSDLVATFRTAFVRPSMPQVTDQTATHWGASAAASRGQLLAVLPTGGGHGSSLLNGSIAQLNPDALVLFGMTEPSLESVLHALTSGISPRFTVFTDGAVDEDLLPRVRSMNDRLVRSQMAGKPLERIFMAFPLESPMPSDVGSIYPSSDGSALGHASRFAMTHAQYISDAVQILLSVIAQDVVNKGAEDAPKAIADRINDWTNTGKISGVHYTYSDRVYSVDRFGNATNHSYHIFVAEGPSFAAWQIDHQRCPVHAARAPISRPQEVPGSITAGQLEPVIRGAQ